MVVMDVLGAIIAYSQLKCLYNGKQEKKMLVLKCVISQNDRLWKAFSGLQSRLLAVGDCPGRIRRVSFLLCILLLWFLLASEAGAVVFVDAASPGGNGTSWGAAYTSLETAISDSGGNQEFWIAKGIYSPSAPLRPSAGSSFYGGFLGGETVRDDRDVTANPTVIDGRSAIIHVFELREPGVLLDGLIIQGGVATGSGADRVGGGVFVWKVSVTFVDCIFRDNRGGLGGAVYVTIGNLTISGGGDMD